MFSILCIIFIYARFCKVKKPYFYIVVLGAGLYGDVLSEPLKRRLVLAKKWYNKNPVPIVVCGGQGKGESVSEASAMAKFLVEEGISSKCIYMEETSTSTYENLKYALPYVSKKDILLISCDFHIFRASCIAKYLGYEVQTQGARSIGCGQIKYYIREVFALIKFWICKK